jgi:hypothetical protein
VTCHIQVLLLGKIRADFNIRRDTFVTLAAGDTVGMNPRKVLYGTDWPLASMDSYLQWI